MAGTSVGTVMAVSGAEVTFALTARGGEEARLGIGALVCIEVPGEATLAGVVHTLRGGRRGEDMFVGQLQLLGRFAECGAELRFHRGVEHFPTLGDTVRLAQPEEERAVFQPGGGLAVEVGEIKGRPELPACLVVDSLLGKHFAVLGSTGCGKSSAVAVLLDAIVTACPHASILLIDPHDEYPSAFGERALALDVSQIELPYWMLTLDELAAVLAPGGDERSYAERAILKQAVLEARRASTSDAELALGLTVDTPVPYRLSLLERLLEEAMGSLDKPEGTAPYRHLLARLAAVRNDPRFRFLFSGMAVRDNLAALLGRLLRLPDEGRPITVLDISGVASEVVDVVVSVLCRIVFEYGLWSEREHRRPVLLVCEEAHRYVPDDPRLGFEPSRRAIDRLAKEGRKYGVALGLVSQRPAELSTSAISQCGTIIAMRMSNERDQRFVERAFPDGSEWMLRMLPALGTGEALVVGQGAPVPMAVRFRHLPPDKRPASATPPFSRLWREPLLDPGWLARTVDRWRRQRR